MYKLKYVNRKQIIASLEIIANRKSQEFRVQTSVCFSASEASGKYVQN
ncbi:MAG: hypothetical protein M3405_13380 [Acidobacteriota bacterium]|nr:hypothetical protein [Acidobacteriota bacterium]